MGHASVSPRGHASVSPLFIYSQGLMPTQGSCQPIWPCPWLHCSSTWQTHLRQMMQQVQQMMRQMRTVRALPDDVVHNLLTQSSVYQRLANAVPASWLGKLAEHPLPPIAEPPLAMSLQSLQLPPLPPEPPLPPLPPDAVLKRKWKLRPILEQDNSTYHPEFGEGCSCPSCTHIKTCRGLFNS